MHLFAYYVILPAATRATTTASATGTKARKTPSLFEFLPSQKKCTTIDDDDR
jgi:hypothetical protein